VEQPLKQRLVGAGVIIALGIIIIPVLLDGAGEQQLREIPMAPTAQKTSESGFIIDKQKQLPEIKKPSQILLSLPDEAELDKDSKKPVQTTQANATKPVEAKPSPAPVPVEVKPVPKPPVATKPVATPKPVVKKPVQTASSATSTVSAWVVQVGSFTDAGKATKLKKELISKKHKAFVEKVRGRSGQAMYRVRVGPIAKRTLADRKSKTLKKTGYSVFVTRHP